jgi:hypothetical protein
MLNTSHCGLQASKYREWFHLVVKLTAIAAHSIHITFFLGGNHHFLWYFHLTRWLLVAVYSLFWFIVGWSSGQELFLWGAGLCGVVAVALLTWEIRTAKHQPD